MNLIITEFTSRKNPVGKVLNLSWDELKNKLKNPVVTDETITEYESMTNEEKTSIKDVGGFVGGELDKGRRSKNSLKNRTILTIDADDATANDVDNYKANSAYVFFVHTTHTSTDATPRLRWVFPLSRPVSAIEYRALIGIIKHLVGADTIDESTDQPERLMFWPSVSFDGNFRYWYGGTEYIDPDIVLSGVELNTEDTTSVFALPNEEMIHEGGRNNALFGLGASLRGKGMGYDEIYSMLSIYNENHCSPPMPVSEVKTIARSVCSYEKGSQLQNMSRTSRDDFSDLGEWSAPTSSKKKQSRGLVGEVFSDLCERDIKPPEYIVDRLIPTGLTLLAAPPKFGKSWFCMDLCMSVASGTDFLGCKTVRGACMYLALEDGDFRLKDRGLKVNGGRPIPNNLVLVENAPGLDEGLIERMGEAIEDYGEKFQEPIKLVIIDTLQRVRGVAGRTEGVYGYDYREVGRLQKFAIKNNISLVIVHHTNKGIDPNDPFNSISGTNGLLGASDCGIVLSRDTRASETTKLHTTGRDVEARTLVLQMNWGNYRWMCLGEDKDVKENEEERAFTEDNVVRTIKYKLDELEDLSDDDVEEVIFGCSSQELLDMILNQYGSCPKENPTALGQYVRSLAPKLLDYEGIEYVYGRPNNKRGHIFKRLKI